MALPYPTKVVLPFDIATAQDMNERHANDVALANGSGLNDGAVTASKIDSATYSTTEKAVGTWTNGSTLYRRTIFYTFTNTGGTQSVAHGVAGLALVVDVVSVTGGRKLPFYLNSGFFRDIRVDNTSIFIEQAGGSIPVGSFPITIYYTKA